ncbi:hypothetical protein WR25_15068 [Diploscapter pachys]|uniref:Uncharacterized protein n=1 Tax=Diploscapter pachys TaxID=2018661 RepID=A0A2A2KFZ9_9BILA|nr:hypothetical protein WR25_15068 [Diploscapter pachys]
MPPTTSSTIRPAISAIPIAVSSKRMAGSLPAGERVQRRAHPRQIVAGDARLGDQQLGVATRLRGGKRPQVAAARSRPAIGEHGPVRADQRLRHRVDLRVREAGMRDRDRDIGQARRLRRSTDRLARRLARFLLVGAVVDDAHKARRLDRRHVLGRDLGGDADGFVDRADIGHPVPLRDQPSRVSRFGRGPTGF